MPQTPIPLLEPEVQRITGEEPVEHISDYLPQEESDKPENAFSRLLDYLRRGEFLTANMARTLLGKEKFHPWEALTGQRRTDFTDVAHDLGMRGTTSKVFGFVGGAALNPVNWIGMGHLTEAGELATKASSLGIKTLEQAQALEGAVGRRIASAAENGVNVLNLGETWKHQAELGQRMGLSFMGRQIGPDFLNENLLGYAENSLKWAKGTGVGKWLKGVFSTSTGDPALDAKISDALYLKRARASMAIPAFSPLGKLLERIPDETHQALSYALDVEKGEWKNQVQTVSLLRGAGLDEKEIQTFFDSTKDMAERIRSAELTSGLDVADLKDKDYLPYILDPKMKQKLIKGGIIPSNPEDMLMWNAGHVSMLQRAFPEDMSLEEINGLAREGGLKFTKPDGTVTDLGATGHNFFTTDILKRMQARYMRMARGITNKNLLDEVGKGWGVYVPAESLGGQIFEQNGLSRVQELYNMGHLDLDETELKSAAKILAEGTAESKRSVIEKLQGALGKADENLAEMEAKGMNLNRTNITARPMPAIPPGYVQASKFNPHFHDAVYLPQEVAQAMGQTYGSIFKSEEMKQAVNFIDQFTRVFRTTTLASPSTGIRDFISNGWTNVLNGTWKNPQSYETTVKLLMADKDLGVAAREAMPAKDLEALFHPETLKGDLPQIADPVHGGLFDLQHEYEMMKEKGVLNSGRVSSEGQLLAGPTEGILNKISEAKPYQMYFDARARIADDLHRAAHYLDKRMQGYSEDYAALSVKKWFGDWHNLTKVEKQLLRPLIPFYSWCVPVDHEILTRDGWKKHHELRLGELVLAFDHKTHELRWEPLKGIHIFDHDGPLGVFDRRGVSFQFTMNHSWPVEVSRRKVKGKWYGGDRLMKKAYALNSSDLIPICGTYIESTSILSPRLAAILGWVVTDGYHRWRGNSCEMMVYQSPKKSLDRIISLLGTKPRKPHPQTGVVCVPVARRDIYELTKIFRRKEDLPKIVGRLSAQAAAAMFEAMFLAEGCSDEEHHQEHFAQMGPNAQPVIEAFQMLCLMTGKNGWQSSAGVYIKRRKHLNVAGGMGAIWYTGEVWCPEVSSGTWVMRHEGGILITGNTKYNFPRQLEDLVTRPGRLGVFGTLKGTIEKGQVKDDADWLPDWIKAGSPIHWRRGDNGQSEYMLMQSFIPAADLEHLMDPRSLFLGSLTPILKEPWQQIDNSDFFFKNKIEKFPGEMQEFLGQPMWARLSHVLRNVRLLNMANKIAFPSQAKQDTVLPARFAENVAWPFHHYTVDLKREVMARRMEARAELDNTNREMRRNVAMYERGDRVEVATKNLKRLQRLRDEQTNALQRLAVNF